MRGHRMTVDGMRQDLVRHKVEMFVRKGIKSKPFNRAVIGIFAACQVGSLTPDGECKYSNSILDLRYKPFFSGLQMEETVELLKAVTNELAESKKVLENLHNEIGKLSEIIQPALLDQIRRIRESRMTVVREVSDVLSSLRDIRKFFIESEHAQEIARLEHFVKLCKEIKELKESGILDGVLDSVVRLSLREENRK